MSLEKLLIFGFALAIAGAVATWSSTSVDKRQTQETGYQTEVGEMLDLMP